LWLNYLNKKGGTHVSLHFLVLKGILHLTRVKECTALIVNISFHQRTSEKATLNCECEGQVAHYNPVKHV
jgi:hypothetical protein